MKNAKTFQFLMVCTLMLCMTFNVFAQEQANESRKATIKIIKEVNGEVTKIERTIELQNGESLEDALERTGLNKEMEAIEGSDENVNIDVDIDMHTEVEGGENHIREEKKMIFIGEEGQTKEMELENDSHYNFNTNEKNVEITEKNGISTIIIKDKDGRKKMIEIERSDAKVNGNSKEVIHFKQQQKCCEKGEESKCCANKIKNVEKIKHNKNKASLGVMLNQEVKDENGIKTNSGIIVKQVFKGSAAEAAGLKKGDIIKAIDEKKVTQSKELIEALSKFEVGDNTKISYERGGKEASTTVKLKENKPQLTSQKECNSLQKIVIKTRDRKNGNKIDIDEIYFNVWIQDVENTDIEKIENVSLKKAATENNLTVESLRFYPNPSDGRFDLSFNLSSKGKTVVRVVNISGQEVFQDTLGDFSGTYEKRIDISQNPKGIYFLQVEQDSKVMMKKIVMQ